MKQITELSEAEILQLTTEQIQKMILFKMAESGIKILIKPGEPIYQPMPEKTILLYSVSGIDFLFESEPMANELGKALQECLPKLKSTSYIGNDYTHKKVITIESYSAKGIGKVTDAYFYSSEDAIKASEILSANEAAKKEYKDLLAEFKTNENEADYIRVEIWDRIKQVQAKHNKMADMKYQYDRYLDLSEGNKKIALNFLKKAYSIDEETECFVQGKEYKHIEISQTTE